MLNFNDFRSPLFELRRNWSLRQAQIKFITDAYKEVGAPRTKPTETRQKVGTLQQCLQRRTFSTRDQKIDLLQRHNFNWS